MSLIQRTTDITPDLSQAVKPVKVTETSLEKTRLDQPYIGKWEDAPEYMHDNEYVKKGYRVNFNTGKRIFKSLFMLHNESINIWSHLCGVILFGCLIAYVAVWLRPRLVFPSFDSIKAHLGIYVGAASALPADGNVTLMYRFSFAKGK